MDDNQTIIQSIRDNQIPLRRVSALEDIDTLNVNNKEEIKNNSYLLLSFNDGMHPHNYKQKISSLLSDVTSIVTNIVDNHEASNNENINELLEDLRIELVALIDKKSTLTSADVYRLIESKHYLNTADVLNLISELDQLTVDEVIDLIRQKINSNNNALLNSVNSDLNDLRNELTSLINTKPHLTTADVQRLINAYPHLTQADVLNIINQQDKLTTEDVQRLIQNNNVSLNSKVTDILNNIDELQNYINENYYTKAEVNELYVNTNQAFNEKINTLTTQLANALQVFGSVEYLSKEEFLDLFSNYQHNNAEKIEALEETVESHTNQLTTLEAAINSISNEMITNVNGMTDISRIDKLETLAATLQADIDEIKEHGYTPEPPMPETTVTESYKTYFWLVGESQLSQITNNNELLSTSITYSINNVTSGCPMQRNKKYNALQLIIEKFSLDSSLDKINEALYIILPYNYLKYDGDNISISNYYLKSNTLDLSVFDKDEKTYNLPTVKTITTVYNYEDNRTETTTENINISYKCLKVVNSIESGLALIYN